MKKLLIGFGVLVVVVIGYLIWYYTNSADEEIHLLPKNFTGVVIIRFDMKNGQEKIFEREKRVYNIPINGILNTKFKHITGLSSPPQFYYLINGMRIPINKHTTKNKVEGLEVGLSMSDITKKSVRFLSYIVGPKEKLDSLYTVREKINIADYK